MNRENLSRKDILHMIETKQISSEQGLSLLKQLAQGTRAAVSTAPSAPTASVVNYYRTEWERADIGAGSQTVDAVLVFERGEELHDAWQERTVRTVRVKPGASYREAGNGIYEIDPANRDDYRKLVASLQGLNLLPSHIFQMGVQGSLDEQLAHGVYSVFFLSQALMEQKVKGTVSFLYAYRTDSGEIHPQHQAVSGFAKAIRQENPNFRIRTLGISTKSSASQIVETALREWAAGASDDAEIRYEEGVRYAKRLQPYAAQSDARKSLPLKTGGVYLITGGIGGLGLIFADYLAHKTQGKLVLTGRSALDAGKQQKIKALEAAGAQVLYVQADVSRREDADRLVREAKSRFGAINGIVHSAGVLRDSFVLKKSREDMDAVLAPKVYGTVNLDEATAGEALDFYVLFSSVAGVMGNVGQSDYAFANTFMDRYAELRNAKKPASKTVSINWPLWKEGGMQADEASVDALTRSTGLVPLKTEKGLQAFEDGLTSSLSQLMVVETVAQPKAEATSAPAPAPQAEAEVEVEALEDNQLRTRAEGFLKNILSAEIKLPSNRIDAQKALEDYGIDSVMILSLSRALESKFGDLSKTLFFEYQTISELAGYFMDNHRAKLLEIVGDAPKPKARKAESVPARTLELSTTTVSRFGDKPTVREPQAEQPQVIAAPEQRDDIAIIGVYGRYPQANSLDEFWENLKLGKDSVTEIPADRWDFRDFYSPDKSNKGTTYSKWGGFIDNVDKFDPLFFNISPREAEILDPQERVFLETVYHAVEDAGYNRERLSKRSVGVFVGVMYGQYQFYGIEETQKGNVVTPSSSFASIANRVSYYFNFNGPSIALDTMCSSSLTAIHLACDSLHKGESEIAVAGGVNLTIHPSKYLMLSSGKFLSTDGRCTAFGEGGDGYVPGEGVGAVLLKPLKQALADGDQVYAVIKSTTLNHGGKTNGYSVPNPNAQASLIADALKKAQIDPRTLSYIEAHGTGTSLGDPIEITGLSKAFREFTSDKQFCSIGSAKSNIGHLESAAGIAGITKVLLQMKHKQLAPSLHANVLNPNINFADSPFYVQRELAEWKQPVVQGQSFPRRAGISSFGAGGSNAHIILEEFETPIALETQDEPQLIVLSAKNEERLREHAQNLLSYLKKATGTPADSRPLANPMQEADMEQELLNLTADVLGIGADEIDPSGDLAEYGLDLIGYAKLTDVINDRFHLDVTAADMSDCASLEALVKRVYAAPAAPAVEIETTENNVSLSDIAYTLQTGREAMDERLAIVASSIEELRETLSQFCAGNGEPETVFRGNVKAGRDKAGLFVSGRAGEEYIKIVMKDKELDILAQLWVSGLELDWQELHGGQAAKRISLPVYPFARERYWVAQTNGKVIANEAGASRAVKLHPLVDSNISDLKEQKFKMIPEQGAFYASEMSVLGQNIFSAAGVLEMVRAVGEMAAGTPVRSIRNLTFSAPVGLQNVSDLQVGLYPFGEEVDFELRSDKNVYAQGRLDVEAAQAEEFVNLDSIKRACTTQRNGAEVYARLQSQGLRYEGGYAVIQEWHGSQTEALARLVLSEASNEYELHPTLLEGALQTALALSDAAGARTLLEVEEVRIDGRLTETIYVHAVQAGASDAYDIRLLGEDGRVLVTMKQAVLAPVTAADALSRVLLEKTWQASAAQTSGKFSGRVLLLANEETQAAAADLFNGHSGIEAVVLRDAAAFDAVQAGEINAFVDLSDLYAETVEKSQDNIAKIQLLQSLIKNLQTDSLTILHLTHGLQTFGNVRPTLAGAETAGLVKMLGAEYRKVRSKTIDIDASVGDLQAIRTIVLQELNAQDAENEVCYRQGKRHLPVMKEVAATDTAPFSLKHPDRVIVVTGGTRGIGAEVAKHLVDKGARKLVLMGVQAVPPRAEWASLLQDSTTSRSVLDRIRLVQGLEANGASVEIYAGSLVRKQELESYFAGIRQQWGPIGGVIHCAGLTSDENPAFINKSAQDIERVFEPKIGGLETLHEVFAGDDLQFFVLFSSVSALIPPLAGGVSDYATANSFMDAFAQFRNRCGDTHYKSINWTNWSGVGMGEVVSPAYVQLGLTAHAAEEGLALLDRILVLDNACVTPCVVKPNFDASVLLKTRLEPVKPAVKKQQPKPIVKKQASGLMDTLKDLFSSELKMPKEKLDEDTSFGDFGVDSILLAELVKKMEEFIGKKLDPSILLEHPTLRELAEVLNTEYIEGAAVEAAAATEAVEEPEVEQPSVIALQAGQTLAFAPAYARELKPYALRPARAGAGTGRPQLSQKIAVIGMACHFPGAPDKETYWRNLAGGVNSVTEIPKSRWDIDRHYSPDHEKGKSMSKWGGFIEGIDEFDPGYFHFSEEDAPGFDPLIRQILEVSVETIRDAGYENKELWGKRVGVFVGSRSGAYVSRLQEAAKNSIVGVGQNFISAHISHFLNLKGPSIVIDTACSSSLVSIHLACQSLLTGESDAALAGGVDILLDENAYIVLSEARALSPDGKCHTFDQSANGFVPGEGCGAVMLKLLDKAIEDGDQIYAVIDATAVNNDGRTMGITTPNLEAQSEVIAEAHRKAGISPSTISYIETHGTGTMIGDPIELKALTKVFRRSTEDTGYCAVGSVKTNFGHLLSAAGVASFMKVVLSIWNKQMPPTLHCETPNPRFKFDASPFYPNTSLQPWTPREGVRRAGISSFGFGGTNAHVIVNGFDGEAGYRPQRRPLPPVVFNRKRYWIDKPADSLEHTPLLLLTDETPSEDKLPLRMLELVDETPKN